MRRAKTILESDYEVEFAHEKNRAGVSLASQQMETAAKTIERAILMRNKLSDELIQYRMRMKAFSHSAGHLPAPLEQLAPRRDSA